MQRFPILMYHALWPTLDDPQMLERYWAADVQMHDPGARLYGLDQRVFARQMQALAQAGCRTPASWTELDGSGADTQVWITFDDGHRSNYELALPILVQYGLKAIFFITTDWIGQPGFMTAEQLRQLRQAGMLLGTHGCSHRYFSDMPLEAVRREMTASKASLEEILGEPVTALSLPGGRSHPQIRQAARQTGYAHLFTSKVELASPEGDSLDWPRIAITNRLPEAFVGELARGDYAALRRMARKARLRQGAKTLLGNAVYDRLRNLLLHPRG